MKCETDAERSEARNFFEKIQKKGPKSHCLALKLYTGPPNCITGASKSGGRGGPGPLGCASEKSRYPKHSLQYNPEQISQNIRCTLIIIFRVATFQPR